MQVLGDFLEGGLDRGLSICEFERALRVTVVVISDNAETRDVVIG